MINQQLLDYIKQQLRQGVSKEEIKNSLLTNGRQAKDIDEAFNSIGQLEQPESYGAPGTTFPQSDISSVKPQKKKLTLIISVILGVMIIGGGVFGYFYYFQSPERIVQKMTEKMTEIKSLEYTGQITVEIETSNLPALSPLGNGNLQQPKEPSSLKQTGKFSIDFSGASDLHDLNNPKALFKFDINTDVLPQSFGLEVRTIENITYLRLSNVPDLGFFDLSFLKNQWIKVDPEAIKKQFGLEKLDEQLKEVQKEQELSPEQIEQIREVVASIKIFEITEKLPSEKIDEANTHHYKFVIDKEGLIELFTEISKIIQNKSLTEKELQELNESLQAIERSEGEIWIGKKDLLLYKILLSLNIKETEKTKSEGKITMTVQFKNYNKAVQIDIPTSVKTLEEILGELFGGLFGDGL
ncbi:MAG: hypothetical protein ACKKMV_01310 [Candidatus Nealsonbacteria bacterium]